jgi:hypothetical protein
MSLASSTKVVKPLQSGASRQAKKLTTSSSDDLHGFGDWKSIRVPFEPFPEPAWRPKSLLAARVVASTAFARFEIHRVKVGSCFLHLGNSRVGNTQCQSYFIFFCI